MALFSKQQHDTYQIGIWKIEESEKELLSLLPHPDKYLKQIQSFKASHRRIEWLSIRVLLLKMLNIEKNICYYKSGEPYLEDASFHISIAHTKEYVTLILSKKYNVGIDIEQYSDRIEKVTSFFIRPDEKTFIYQGSMIWSLLLHWCAKETIYKCLHSSQVDFVKHLRVFVFEIKKEGSFKTQEYRTEHQQIYNIQYSLNPDFVLTYTLY